jgi:FdhD protein
MATTTSATRHPARRIEVTVVEAGTARASRDHVVGEEPMEIRVAGPGQEATRVAVTMRTPGNDFELAAGFLFTEGLVASNDEIASIRYCADADEQQYNVVTVDLRRPFDPATIQRNYYATSSCGVCGKASLEAIEVRCAPVADGLTVTPEGIIGMPDALRAAQRVFERTGGLHAAALFQPSGELVEVREDVGRHNAVDKLIGSELLAGRLPLSDRVMMVSGRSSFELVQKAAVAGLPVVCSVSAPSSLAVETARRLGVTLVGFLRGDRFTVYSGAQRIDTAAGA